MQDKNDTHQEDETNKNPTLYLSFWLTQPKQVNLVITIQKQAYQI